MIRRPAAVIWARVRIYREVASICRWPQLWSPTTVKQLSVCVRVCVCVCVCVVYEWVCVSVCVCVVYEWVCVSVVCVCGLEWSTSFKVFRTLCSAITWSNNYMKCMYLLMLYFAWRECSLLSVFLNISTLSAYTKQQKCIKIASSSRLYNATDWVATD